MSTMHDETKTIICKNCGYENNKQSKFCPNCGEKIVREDICANCGAKIDPSLKFCQECGSKIPKFIALEKAEAECNVREKAEAERKACEAERKARKKADAERKAREKAEAKRNKAREEAGRRAREKAEAEGEFSLVGIDMVRIPDSAKHKGLFFGRYQVTQAQWQSIMGNNPSHHKCDLSCPVENVSWNDCQEFIKQLNARIEVESAGIIFRLPTEEEWEYACRAGSTGKYGLLADGREGTLDEMGWYTDNSGDWTHPVGQKKPNAWGLYDMHGNVWEWTDSEDYWGRIIRGGCWCNHAGLCEADSMHRSEPDIRFDNQGFRLVASMTGK